MKQYRKKDAPLALVPQPKTLTIDGMAVLKSRNDFYTDAQMLAAGYYLDVSVQPTDSQKWSDDFSWDEEAGTVTRGVEVKSAEELAEEKKQTAIMELANTDNTTIRIVEDLTELLLKKGVILKSELPSKAVEKMGIRKQQRMIIAASDGVSIEEDVEYTGDSLWTTIKSWFGF